MEWGFSFITKLRINITFSTAYSTSLLAEGCVALEQIMDKLSHSDD